MKLILIASAGNMALSDELACARSQMLSLLPAGVLRREVFAPTLPALIDVARREAEVLGLAVSDSVLLLRNPFLYWASGTLERLQGCLEAGAEMVSGFDSTDTIPGQPPDYLTIRGLERYAAALKGGELASGGGERFPAMLLCRAGALSLACRSKGAIRLQNAYAHDFSGYHEGRREDVLPFLPPSIGRILDVGGGGGGFLETLKSMRQCETHLSEFSPAACQRASGRVDRVWPGDFLSMEFDRQFDCVTFLDVLEHAVNPHSWLAKATALLAPAGCVVASIPNVGHWSVVADLLEGRWDYAAAGIHCITHVRFFTRRGVAHLFAEAGLEIVELHPTRIEAPAWFDCSSFSGNLAVDRDSLSTYAFLIVARRLA